MPKTEKQIESCGRLTTIPIIIMILIIFITGIIELSKQNDNLFLLIIFITATVFITFCLSLYIFSNYCYSYEEDEHDTINGEHNTVNEV